MMTCTVLLEVNAKAGTGGDLVGLLRQILPDTRAYDGCISVDVHQNQDDTDVILLVEHWQSRAHYEKYFAWRDETGALATLAEHLAAPPNLRYFDPTDA